jgi:hypothetical protein
LPSRSTATICLVPQFENHRRPSCHRGDSGMARPSSSTRGCMGPPFVAFTDKDATDGEDSSVGGHQSGDGLAGACYSWVSKPLRSMWSRGILHDGK